MCTFSCCIHEKLNAVKNNENVSKPLSSQICFSVIVSHLPVVTRVILKHDQSSFLLSEKQTKAELIITVKFKTPILFLHLYTEHHKIRDLIVIHSS